MQTVAVVGLGLIGGSFALALRHHGFGGLILGVDEPPFTALALRNGVIHRSASLTEVAASADLIYLSRSVDGILSDIENLHPALRPECLVTDCGSTKRAIAEQAARFLPAGQFLGGHPMAGKAVRGLENAEPALFTGKPYVLCPAETAPHPHEAAFRQTLSAIGANVLNLTPAQHDHAVAFTSHLPQLLATALAATLSGQPAGPIQNVYGQGLLDMTRLAQSSPELWQSILATNQDQIAEALAHFQAALLRLSNEISAGQTATTFAEAHQFTSLIQASFNKT